MPARSVWLLWLVAAVSLLGGCADGIGVDTVRPELVRRETQKSVLTGDGPSEWTLRTARYMGYELEGSYSVSYDAAIAGMESDIFGNDPEALIAAAELALQLGLDSGPNTEERRSRLLLAASLAHDGLLVLVGDSDLPLGEAVPLGLGVYNRAVGEVAGRLFRDLTVFADPADPHRPITVGSWCGAFEVDLERGRRELARGPEYFDEIYHAGAMRLRGLRHRHARSGLGAPMIGWRAYSESRRGAEPFVPPEGVVYPLTARLRFGDRNDETGRRRATLMLSDPVNVESVRIGQRRVALSADFSAPHAWLHARAKLGGLGQQGLLDADSVNKRPGLYLLDPFDPDRIPVVLVHGLLSSPLTWADVVNDIRGDPFLRDRYQIWMFLYPTGLPIPASAKLLRDSLDEIEEAYDPYGLSDDLRHKVLVGHSMGGVLSRLVVSDVGDDLWNEIFTLAPDELEVSDETRAWLESTMFWEPEDTVGRAVFVAAPHRGSSMALDITGRLGSFLVNKPDELEAIGKELYDAHGPGVYQGSYGRRWSAGVPTSIDTLSPDDPLVKVLEKRGPPTLVPFHSIIGDRGKPDADPVGDGVVPYESASLEGAQSEFVVPAPHGAHEHPLAIREIRRILSLHVRELDRARRNAD